MIQTKLFCPKCHAESPMETRYCEICGASLSADDTVHNATTASFCRCGQRLDDGGTGGYCPSCGRRGNGRPRDHVEIIISDIFAGVSDRGVRHDRNEDHLALASDLIGDETVYIAVVCDGVSSSSAADRASAIVARATCEALQAGIKENPLQDSEAVMATAIMAGHKAACEMEYIEEEGKTPPGTTTVAALVRGRCATVGWVGDSRAYLINHETASMLTHDHSWINEMVDSGEMTEAEAEDSPHSHAITRCLGPINLGELPQSIEPSLMTFQLPHGAKLILCSDGFWNYASKPEIVLALIETFEAQEAIDLARQMVEYANRHGGRDNITVAVLGKCLNEL